MNDEELYLEATNEVEGENKNPGLWAKVMALSEGDQEKAKYKYIKLRAEQLANERKNAAPTFTKKSVDEFDLKYMPIAEFSKIKSIPETKVIQMIRDGFYVGQIKNEAWYVSRGEVKKSDQVRSPPKQYQNENIKTEKEYVPVQEFAEFKGITQDKAIQMIRDGFYEGQLIDNHWHVAYSEISKANKNQKGPSGVGGWLMLLVAGMMVLGPLLGAGRISADIMMVEHQYPELVNLSEWGSYKTITWWTFLLVAAISVYGGWGLANGREWGVVKRAKAILWITGPIASIVLALIVPLISFGEVGELYSQFIGSFIGTIIAASIWTAYLSKSKRVRNTYHEGKSDNA